MTKEKKVSSLWRLHIRPTPVNGKTHDDVVNFCIQKQIAGIGWPVAGNPKTPTEYTELAKKKYHKRPASAAFAEVPQIGDYIWARDLKGIYYLGKIMSDWSYVNTLEANELDIPNQRSCRWVTVGNEEKVPGKIISCFRPSRAFQSINNHKLEEFTTWMYEGGGSPKFENFSNMEKGQLFDLIDDQDCEDLVGLFIQYEYGYLLIPSSCKRETIAYEYILKHRETGETAIAQVKHGIVALDERLLHSAERIFLFSSSGQINSSSQKIEVITPKQIIDFCFAKKHVLPERIVNWLNFLAQ